MTELSNHHHSGEKRSFIYEPKEEDLYTNYIVSAFDVNKMNIRPEYTTQYKSGKEPRKKQSLTKTSLSKCETIYKQSLKGDLLKKKKKALLNQNSLSIGTPTTARRERRTITLDASPKNDRLDLFDLRISPIRSSKENSSILVPKKSSSKYSSIEQMHSLEIQNRSLNARKKRYIPTSKLLDSSFKSRPFAPDPHHFLSFNQDDSMMSRDSDIKFFSHNNSINHNNNNNNSSFMSSNIGSTDSSMLGDISQDQSFSSLKTKRKLKISRNHIWMNVVKNGIVTPNSNLIPEDIKVHLRTDEQKAKNNKTLATIEHDDRENDSPTTNNTSKSFYQRFESKGGPRVFTNSTIESRHDSIQESRHVQNRRHTEESKHVTLLEKLKELNKSKGSIRKSDQLEERSQERSQSLPVNDNERVITGGKDSSWLTSDQKSMIEVALNNLKTPLPDSKFPYKLVSEKLYDHSVGKLQRIKNVFYEFKNRVEKDFSQNNKLPVRPKKTPLKEIGVNAVTQTDENVNTMNTNNTSILSTEESDPTKELQKAKISLKKKNDALKYLKYHYIKIKKKNIITAFNMITRLVKRKVLNPTFQEILYT